MSQKDYDEFVSDEKLVLLIFIAIAIYHVIRWML
jgi:hypothetical protein